MERERFEIKGKLNYWSTCFRKSTEERLFYHLSNCDNLLLVLFYVALNLFIFLCCHDETDSS